MRPLPPSIVTYKVILATEVPNLSSNHTKRETSFRFSFLGYSQLLNEIGTILEQLIYLHHDHGNQA